MQCRAITKCEFDLIRAELSDVICQVNSVETIIGHHEQYGVTTLVRDGSRRMALVDHPAPLDRFLAEQAFLADGTTTIVAGRG